MKRMTASLLCLLLCLMPVSAENWVEMAGNIDSLDAGKDFLRQWERNASEPEDTLALGIALHQLCSFNAKRYGDRALEVLASLDDAEALAYHGSVLTLIASETAEKRPIRALSLLKEGAEEIDLAVGEEPNNINLRILRVSNGVPVSLTSPSKRFDVLEADIPYIEAWLLETGDSADKKAEFYYYLGEIHLGLEHYDEALDSFYRSADLAPESSWAEISLQQIFLLEE